MVRLQATNTSLVLLLFGAPESQGAHYLTNVTNLG